MARHALTAAEVGAAYKLARLQAGLPLGELAKRLDISPATLSRREHGTLQATLLQSVAWAEALGYELGDVLQSARTMHPQLRSWVRASADAGRAR